MNTQPLLQRQAAQLLTTVAAVTLLIGLGGPAALAAEAITDGTVDAAVRAAKTPEDHSALAAYFRAKAEAATAAAKEHAKMETAQLFARKSHNESWAKHCQSLIGLYRRQAEDYSALAKLQEDLAKGGDMPKSTKGM